MRPVGTYLAPARFLAFLILLVITTWLMAMQTTLGRATMIGFDVASIGFLLSLAPLMRRRDADEMRAVARQNDANRVMLLVISGAVIAAILIAVGVEVTQAKQLGGLEKLLVVGTLVLAWLFSNSIYTLHYAHIYYLEEAGTRRDRGGINFPGKGSPDYSDFFYFAFTLGMTFQTSDSNISTRGMRRVVIVHCIVAFVFNIGVLAFTINVLGSGG